MLGVHRPGGHRRGRGRSEERGRGGMRRVGDRQEKKSPWVESREEVGGK